MAYVLWRVLTKKYAKVRLGLASLPVSLFPIRQIYILVKILLYLVCESHLICCAGTRAGGAGLINIIIANMWDRCILSRILVAELPTCCISMVCVLAGGHCRYSRSVPRGATFCLIPRVTVNPFAALGFFIMSRWELHATESASPTISRHLRQLTSDAPSNRTWIFYTPIPMYVPYFFPCIFCLWST